MKTAVVVYSQNGNCAFIAEEIKASLGADVIRLHTEKETNRKGRKRRGFAGFFWAVGVMKGFIKAPLKPYTFNPAAYDLIIIGAPVWNGAPARPIHDFLVESSIKGKKTALFLCHGGGMGKAMEKFKALLPFNEITAEAGFVYPRKNSQTAKQQVADWVKSLQS